MIQQIIQEPNHMTLFGISIDAIMSAIIALVVIGLSYLASKGLENFKERKRLKQIEAYFWTLIDNISEPIQTQIKLYSKTAEELDEKDHKDFVYFETPDLNLHIFATISPKDLHTIFLSKKKLKLGERTKHFTKIINTIEFIKSQKISMKQNFVEFFSDFRKYEDSWQKNGEAVFRYFDNFLHYNKSNNILPSQDAFMKKMDSIISSWSKLEKSKNFYVAYDNLIKPLRNLCIEFPIDPCSNMILPFLVEADYAFNNIDNVKAIYKKLFSYEAKNLEKRYGHLKESVEVFKNV